MKLSKKVKVKNDLGIHARPAAYIVKLLLNCKSHVTFTHKKETINAKSIMSILMLAVGKNSQITIKIDGEDAEEVMESLELAFENHFEEQKSL